MKQDPDKKRKLKQADPKTRHFISALKLENLDLQKKIAKLQAKVVSQQNRIIILEKVEKQFNRFTNISDEELDNKIIQLEQEIKEKEAKQRNQD